MLLTFAIAIILVYLWDGAADEVGEESHFSAASRQKWEEGLPPVHQSQLNSRAALSPGGSPNNNNIHTASIDTVIRYLNKLAHMPAAQLWDVLGMDNSDHGNDPFSLRELESGKCPWSTDIAVAVDWLPPRPANSETIAEKYRSNTKSMKKGRVEKRRQMERYDPQNEVVLWYEHMSKAGGTTFCGLAQSNMLTWQVPRYHCMPRKGDLNDGRVGSWPNEELLEYLLENKYGIVSNEWEPFSLEKLELSGRHLEDGSTSMRNNNNNHVGPQILFLTTLRDTSDRLLSAYTFFALTVTENARKKNNNDGPTFSQWIERLLNRAGNYRMGSKGSGFRSNIARMNHIVWRFSGGKLSHLRSLEESEWKPPFETAIRSLSQQDLILPMDVMTQELGKTALQQLLGWDQFDVKGRQVAGDKVGGHVVTVGGIKNSNAREYFSKDAYRALWEENWLDNILYLWCRAVFLARLHCKDVIVES